MVENGEPTYVFNNRNEKEYLKNSVIGIESIIRIQKRIFILSNKPTFRFLSRSRGHN